MSINLRLPAPLKEVTRRLQVNTHFISTDQTLVGAKADSVVRGTQLFHSKHFAHISLLKGLVHF